MLDEIRARLAKTAGTDADEGLRRLLGELHPEDIAEFLADLSVPEKQHLFSLLDAGEAALVLQDLDVRDQSVLLRELDQTKASEIIEAMSSDDLADLLGDIPEQQAVDILGLLEEEDAADVRELLAYLEDSAGGIMTTEFIALREDIDAAAAINALRRLAPDAETIYYVYVVDAGGRLVGVLSLRDLIVADPGVPIRDIMETKVISVAVHTDQEEVARIVAKYDLLAVPVVDDARYLLGIITVDDVIDVIEEEATEDIFRLAGHVGVETETADSTLARARYRLPWLIVLLFGEILAANTIKGFTDTLQAMVALAYFIPVLIGMGGNVATQSLAVAVRGLATGELDSRELFRVLLGELKVGLVLGLGSGLVVFVVAVLWQGIPAVGIIVGAAMALDLVFAAVIGTLAPFLLFRLKIDPAVASGPFATTIMDVVGVLVYFSIATALIHRLLPA